MKKIYTAPSAEITMLAPTDPIAVGEWKDKVSGDDRWWIGPNFNYWGDNLPSATNVFWYDFGTSEIAPENQEGSN